MYESQIFKALIKANASGYAIAAFNAPSFDSMLGLAMSARYLNRPVIIQTSARYVKQATAPVIYRFFDTVKNITGAECYLHLDHCHDIDLITQCLKAGWDMVMFDGSGMTIDENIKQTQAAAQIAADHGAVIEGEIGAIGGEEDGFSADAFYASDDHIRRLAHETDIACLAVAFGNVHGAYETKSNLRWDIFERSGSLSGKPLVLHGGSGLSTAEFMRAIDAGAAKINISTDLKLAYAATLRDETLARAVQKDPTKVHSALTEASRKVGDTYIRIFSRIDGNS